MTERPGDDREIIDRVRRLFLYLRDLAELRTKTVRDCASYERVIWFNDLPRDAGHSAFIVGSDTSDLESWLEIDRVTLPRAPEPPGILAGWLRRSDFENADLELPVLLDRGDEEVERPEDLEDAYWRYIEGQWQLWAELYRRIEPAHDFYTELFAIAERQQALGEVYELVVGIGLLVWQLDAHQIRRHLITSPVDVAIDRDTGRITVRPSESPDAHNRLELEMLEPSARGNPKGVRELTDQIAEMDSLALPVDSEQLLRQWLNQAHSSGSVEPSLAPSSSAREVPQIVLAPALVLRKRGQRTLGTLLEAIAQQVVDTGEIPQGVRALAITDDLSPLGLGEAAHIRDPEVYFPLASNDEQRQVVDRLQDQFGILVQGPPGTGKSHTIANLISHLLAQGKRVLVTSHTERALRVLHDKLPHEIKPLCISLLGRDRESVRALEASVEEISVRQADWSDLQEGQAVEGLRSQLRDVRDARATAEADLRRAREAETHEISIGSYTGTAQRIAQALQAEHEERGWIDGAVSPASPPMTSGEFARLLELTWELPSEADEYANVNFPDPDELIGASDLERLRDLEQRIVDDYAAAKERFGDELDRWGKASVEALEHAELVLRDLARRIDEVARSSAWAESAAGDILNGHSDVWLALHCEASEHQAKADDLVDASADLRVVLADGHGRDATLAGAEDLLEHTRNGGRLRTGLFAGAAVKRHRWLLEEVELAGRPVDSEAQLTALRNRLQLEVALDRVSESWQSVVEADPSSTARQRVAFYAAHLAALDAVLDAVKLRERADEALAAVGDGHEIADWADAAELRQRSAAMHATRESRDVEAVREEAAQAKQRLGDGLHPIVSALRQAVDAREVDVYRRHLDELRRVVALAHDARERNALADRLRTAAPALVDSLPTEPSNIWRQHAVVFEESWRWKHAHDELARLSDPELPQRLNAAIARLTDHEREALAQLSAKLAWQRMFAALGTEQAMALRAWAEAVKSIGKGTGKRAPQLRRAAREYMGQARDAIPAWIMPMYRVAESLTVQPNPFDVVIVDEASQSSVESLFLLYLAKQIIVVGDDQQIAPDAVGVNVDEVQRLQREYLGDIPFSALYTPNSSLFAQAAIRFPKRIVLREHFRCMPEIIEFSNRIAYKQKSLLPLRQFGADRLDPIKTVYLAHGHREGSRDKINEPEADEVVARIEKLLSDSRYDEKSIGVISLQGEAQARLIERMLLERIGPQAFVERNITCGDAYAFQGDERNVIFLSMVAAPNAAIGALSTPPARRRFNVAASRAQDQVWLVHSVRPEDLSTTDMRREMLEYYLHPQVERLEEFADFDPSQLNKPFDSKFEQDVYLKIRRRGYRVAPQVPVARYSIDLVVEGANGRLAVECDGDAWHGALEWDRDMARQRQLERCGWSFVRIRGSDFYRDSSSALEPLWRELARRGIQPHQVLDADVVTSVEPVTTPADEDHQQLLADPEIARADQAEFAESEEPEDAEAELDDEGAPTLPLVGLHADEPAPSREWPLEWGEQPHLGVRVTHSRKGAGRVSVFRRNAAFTETFVRIRFESGEEYDYTPEEYHHAGFVIVDPERQGWSEEAAPTVGHESSASPLETPTRPHRALPSYPAWEGSGFPDPRSAARAQLGERLLQVIEAEAPITTDRAYRLFIKAAGYSRVTQPVRSKLNRGLWAISGRLDVDEFENPETNWPQRVLRLRDNEPVVIREIGPRDLFEVPLNEIAALMRQLSERTGTLSGEELKRAVLEAYDRVRLTSRVDRYLGAALNLVANADSGTNGA